MYPRHLLYITEKQVISTNLWRNGCTPALFSAPPQTDPWNVSVRVYPAGTEDPSALWGHNSSSSVENLTSHTHRVKTTCDITVCQTEQIIIEIFRSDRDYTECTHIIKTVVISYCFKASLSSYMFFIRVFLLFCDWISLLATKMQIKGLDVNSNCTQNPIMIVQVIQLYSNLRRCT